MTHDKKMPGDYEFHSLHHGPLIQRQWNKNRINFLEQIKFIEKNHKVLDAGCGSGNVVLKFAKKAKEIEGWDINNNSINFLSRELKKRGIKNAKTKVIDLTRTKNDKSRFDRIVLAEVIEHFTPRQYEKMLENLKKTLNKKGKIFITTPNDDSYWLLLEKALNLFQKYVQKIPTLEDRHLVHFNEKKLSRIVIEAGFEVERVGTLNFLSPFLFFLPEGLRDYLSTIESKHVKIGPLLYVVAIKR